jgi:chemotaxis family two-component system response regulator Rcp1
MGVRDGSILCTDQTTQRMVELLLVEDEPSEILLMQLALKGGPIPTHLSVAQDGEQALAFLRGHSPSAARRPDLILLSLFLPKKGGLELLTEIKGDPALRAIPTLIFTSSISPHHIRQSYTLHANCYITKPIDLDAYSTLVQEIVAFWGRGTLLPADF